MAKRAVLGAVTLFALSACNAILGMEHAHLDEGADAGTGNDGSGGRPVTQPSGTGAVVNTVYQTDCTAESDTCQQCVDKRCGLASKASDKCLEDPDCRGVIQSHTQCMANASCHSSECSSILSDNLEDPAHAAFGSCVAQCATDCDGKAIFPICKLYCACMMATCTDEASMLGATAEECVQRCNSDETIYKNASCRENHCEIASSVSEPSEHARHCSHAVGGLNNCVGKIKICTSGKPSGIGPCQSGADCCSKICNGDHVCQD